MGMHRLAAIIARGLDDDPARINSLETEFKKVTSELIQKTAKEYLRPTNRTILIVDPKAPNP